MRVNPTRVFVFPDYCSGGLWSDGGLCLDARDFVHTVPPLLLQSLWCWHQLWESTNGIEGGGKPGRDWYAYGEHLVAHMNACQNEIEFVYKADLPT